MKRYAWLSNDDMKTGESAWTLIHRFCYRNGIGFLELIEILNSYRLEKTFPKTAKVYLRVIDFEVIDGILNLIPRGVENKNMLTYEYLCESNASKSSRWIVANWLRYCPVCLLNGSHLIINQLRFKRTCVIHPGVNLLDTCHKCGVAIPYVSPRCFRDAFSCPSCGCLFLSEDPPSVIHTWPDSSNFVYSTPLNLCFFSFVMPSCVGEQQLCGYLDDAEVFLSFDGLSDDLRGKMGYCVRTIEITPNDKVESFEVAYNACSQRIKDQIELAKNSQGPFMPYLDFAENIYYSWRLYWEGLPSEEYMDDAVFALSHNRLRNLLRTFNRKYPPEFRKFLGNAMSGEIAYQMFKVMIEISFLHHLINEQWLHENKYNSSFTMSALNDSAAFFILKHSGEGRMRAHFFIPTELQLLSEKF